tara:strand:+ start:21 stop:581 length:561 start_codon:yes stop_codon:yes gene_type:complete
MDDKNFISEYLKIYNKSLIENDISNKLILLKNKLITLKGRDKKVIIAGNGASASISSHVSVDFTKQAKIKTINFNEANLITCFSNDYGYEFWLEKAIEFYAQLDDIVILVSSSGKSKNIINAALKAKKMNLFLVSFTGFKMNNEVSKISDLSFWVDSKSYNVIENIHQIWLLMVCDLMVGKIQYKP